jgi:hypothetical protein
MLVSSGNPEIGRRAPNKAIFMRNGWNGSILAQCGDGEGVESSVGRIRKPCKSWKAKVIALGGAY